MFTLRYETSKIAHMTKMVKNHLNFKSLNNYLIFMNNVFRVYVLLYYTAYGKCLDQKTE